MNSKRTRIRRSMVRFGMPVIVLAILLMRPVATYAHPLGNFTVNRYSRLELGASDIRIRYIVDMAEIPTFQEMPQIDTSGDGKVDAAESDQYLTSQIERLQGNLHLSVAGTAIALQPGDEQLTFPAGQGGLQTLRISAWFSAPLPQSAMGQWQTTYQDNNFGGRIGWQEIVVQPAGPVTILNSTAPATDKSQELTSYPTDMLQSPLVTNSASFAFEPGGTNAGAPVVNNALATSNAAAPDRFAALIAQPLNGPLGLLGAILLAFVLGAGHALAPGHGKTVVAAYLVGSRGTARHAIFLGLTTTITHTAGVFGLGLVTLFISQFILPEQFYPWLGVASGLLVVAIGYTLARSRLLGLIGRSSDDHHGHDHSHDHDHDHAHSHTHADGHTHSHLPPGTNGEPMSWRSLLALGVSGGLLPCPSALVVLLSAIALQRVGLGMVLIIAFSLGLASVLTAIGIMLVYAGRWFSKISFSGRLPRVLPMVSAVVVTVIGLGITFEALAQTGLIGR